MMAPSGPARDAHEEMLALAADGAPLELPGEIGDESVLVARYVDKDWAAFLFLFAEDPDRFEQLVEVYSRDRARSWELEASATSDWYGPLGGRPPSGPFWMSGFEVSARHRGDEAAAFVTGVVAEPRYLGLLRHYSSGEVLSPGDAPFGPFIARIGPSSAI